MGEQPCAAGIGFYPAAGLPWVLGSSGCLRLTDKRIGGGHPLICFHPLLLSFPNETGFRISRCRGHDCDEILVGANVTTYDDDEVCGGPSMESGGGQDKAPQASGDVSYCVRAYNPGGTSACSNTVAVEVYCPQGQPGSAPARDPASIATPPAPDDAPAAAPAAAPLDTLPNGQTWRSYYFLGGQRVAMRQVDADGERVLYLVGDHLGSTSLVLDANGAKVAESRYYPYGEERWSSGTLPTDYRFTGARHEASLGLYHMGARWYDPSLARWLSADTLVPEPGNPQSFNRYSYVRNNPLRYIDPTGHIKEGEEAADAAEILELLMLYGVEILVDWGYMDDGAWGEGLWTVEALGSVLEGVQAMAEALGGMNAFKETYKKGLTFVRAHTSQYGARRAETDPKGRSIWIFDAAFATGNGYRGATSDVIHELAHAWDFQNGRKLSKGLEEAVGGQTTFTHVPWIHRLLFFYGYKEEVYTAPGREFHPAVVNRREDWAYSVEAMVYGLETSMGEFIQKGGTDRYAYVAQALPGWNPQYHKPGR